MNIAQIENNLQKLIKSFSKETFIYDLLLAFGLPKASISRLQKGNLNLARTEGELSWKKKLLFKEVLHNDLHLAVSELADQVRHDQRFVMVTDYKTLLAIDTKTQDKLDIELKNLPRHYDFFLPWAGMEKYQGKEENIADIKAAERMAKLFDEIKKDNPDTSPEFLHGLNVFLSRLLFCFFAEDTHIFKEKQFINAISSHTQADGSDLKSYLDKLFDVLNTPKKERKDLPEYLDAFPYVNGGLFRQRMAAPVFTRRSRQAIIDSGTMDWSAINPDIFGSMIQAVITPEHRGGLGMHYTSVPNIMKVIEPLFLTDLYEAFEKAKANPKKLNELLYRLSKLKIFDPACGSGNFLIIAYKELRKLEIKIIQQLQALQRAASGFDPKSEQLSFIPKSQLSLAASFQVELFSRIQLNQFYGIELDDFAHEIAQLSLWLAEHQMNVEFKKEFGQANPTLPLKEAGQITHGNACRLDWETVCPKGKDDEIYILGNPPYLGAHLQSKIQKADIEFVFKGMNAAKKLDYISCWFYKGANFVGNSHNKLAFVSTNSICQGEQVAILWPNILLKSCEIFFAYQSFLWTNNAKGKAAVYCVVVGISGTNVNKKNIFSKSLSIEVENISPYLLNGSNTIVGSRAKALSDLPLMMRGSSPVDGGNLILSLDQVNALLKVNIEAEKFIKRLVGADDYLNGKERWCLWIKDKDLKQALKIDEIKKRIGKVKQFRLSSSKAATREASSFPHRFFEKKHREGSSIIVPRVTSERRRYLQCGFLDENSVVLDRAQVIYTKELFPFSILSSKMHYVWTCAVSGRLKMDINYSVSLCYNNFPFPPISELRKQEITQCVFRILEEREKHSEKTLAQLYDPNEMPEGLREAHHANDIVIEKCYRSKPFESDEERLEYLFKLYERMIAEEKEKGGLFEKQKKTKKRAVDGGAK